MALRSFADGALFAEVFGQGQPRVIALHGWGRRGADFRQSLHDFPALAPDLPGFGASPIPDSVIGADGYADIVAQMLDDFDESPVLVGHSFGGRVAVCLAAKFPEKVGPLVEGLNKTLDQWASGRTFNKDGTKSFVDEMAKLLAEWEKGEG